MLKGQTPNAEKFSIREELPGPFVLAPDDVITIRVRARFGIDWSERWTIDVLREFAAELDRPIVFAELEAAYRRSDTLVRQRYTVPIDVVQQELYLEALRRSTRDFSFRPNYERQPIWD
ncbi:MAG: hypothetical protein IT336_10275 [Thermomicrobiales bacterium]|nr:hypothetical protein [Thermomicrobiales bacterium]